MGAEADIGGAWSEMRAQQVLELVSELEAWHCSIDAGWCWLRDPSSDASWARKVHAIIDLNCAYARFANNPRFVFAESMRQTYWHTGNASLRSDA